MTAEGYLSQQIPYRHTFSGLAGISLHHLEALIGYLSDTGKLNVVEVGSLLASTPGALNQEVIQSGAHPGLCFQL